MATYDREFPKISLDDLADLRKYVEQSALSLGASEDEAGDLVLAVNEAVVNVIYHGYGKQPGLVKVTLEVDKDSITVRIYDRSPSFDPTKVKPPDITVPLEERLGGGLGVHMIRSFTDEMVYSILPAGGNELVLVKRLST